MRDKQRINFTINYAFIVKTNMKGKLVRIRKKVNIAYFNILS
jgi:hypothetical protein